MMFPLRTVALAGLFPVCAAAQSAVPVIDMEATEGGLTVTGIVAGTATGTVEAEMSISRNDGSGTVQTSQSRRIDVTSGSRDTVATTGLSTGPDLHMQVVLTLREDGTVIATSETEIDPSED